MTNANDPANAVESEVMENYENRGWYKDPYSKKPFGLTKREHFAAMALQGLCSYAEKGEYILVGSAFQGIAELSVEMADALINALNKKQ